MLLQPRLGGNRQRPCYGQQPRLPFSMPALIDGNSFEPKIDRGEMGAGGNAALAQDRGGQQPTEPGRRWSTAISFQASSATIAWHTGGRSWARAKHSPPLSSRSSSSPIEIVDEGILFRSVFGAPRLLRLFDRGLRPGEDRIDRGKRITQTINVGILRLPTQTRVSLTSTFPSGNPPRLHPMMLQATPARGGRRGLEKRAPRPGMGGDATAGFQDVAGDGEFVGGGADISKRIM